MDKQDYLDLREVFSEQGLKKGPMEVRVTGDLDSKISLEDDHIMIKFTDNQPEVTLKILRAKVEGVKLGNNGGHLLLDGLPNIPFFYSWLNKEKKK